MRTGGDITRKRLLTTALVLFTQKPYNKVTLKDIEAATGLSRGAVMYYAENKESLFKQAVELFVFRNNTLTALKPEEMTSLEGTIKSFVRLLTEEQRHWREIGIKNINFALFNVQVSYYNLYKGTRKQAGEWYENECRIWRGVIEAAIASGEIREVDADELAHIFEDVYFGTAYAGLARPTGYSPARVGRQLMTIYRFVKA